MFCLPTLIWDAFWGEKNKKKKKKDCSVSAERHLLFPLGYLNAALRKTKALMCDAAAIRLDCLTASESTEDTLWLSFICVFLSGFLYFTHTQTAWDRTHTLADVSWILSLLVVGHSILFANRLTILLNLNECEQFNRLPLMNRTQSAVSQTQSKKKKLLLISCCQTLDVNCLQMLQNLDGRIDSTKDEKRLVLVPSAPSACLWPSPCPVTKIPASHHF